MAPKQRGPRCTAEQMEIIINYMQIHRIMVTGRTHPNNIKEIDDHWKKLSETLNSARGARKTVEEWRRFFTEWKSKTRAKARDSKTDLTATGGGPYKDKKLSDLEERLMLLIGWVSVSGTTDLPPEIDPDINEAIELTENVVDNIIIENLVVDNNPDDEDTLLKATPAPVPSQSRVFAGKKKLKFSRNKPASTITTSALEKSVEIYAESNIRLTTAIEGFAESLTKMATAVEKCASAMEKLALKQCIQD